MIPQNNNTHQQHPTPQQQQQQQQLQHPVSAADDNGRNASIVPEANHHRTTLTQQQAARYDDSDAFQLVENKRKKNHAIFGSKTPQDGNRSIAGQRIVRELDVFIGGVQKEITVEDFTNYIKDELNVDAVNVIVNKLNSFNQSFKVTIKNRQKHHL